MRGNTLGARLTRYRQHRQWSQRELERLAGLAHGTVSRIERGTHAPSAAVVHHLAQVLGIAVCQLFPPMVEEDAHVA